MVIDKTQTLKQVSREMTVINSNLQQLGHAVLDCAKDEPMRSICLEAILAARASVIKAQIYLENLKPKENELEK